jgi:predicted RNA binding protein YcfA (HicA-like mRNA interferase family)
VTRGGNALGRTDDAATPMPPFPSMKAKRLLAVLMREPLNYRIVRRTGSHRTLKAPGRPTIVFGFHDRDEVWPVRVRDVLVKQVGLEEAEALDLL